MLESAVALEKLFTEFVELAKDESKTANGKARKVSNQITKLLPVFRKESVEFDKANTKKRESKTE